MATHRNTPIQVEVENRDGDVVHARVRFGPHFAVDVHDEDGNVSFTLVYTHHGFRADATEVSGELERIIDQVRAAHPEALVD